MMVPNGVPVIGEGGQQLTMYNTNSGAPGGVIYPEKPLGPPVAPEVRSNLPGGQTQYVQPNYEKNRKSIIIIENIISKSSIRSSNFEGSKSFSFEAVLNFYILEFERDLIELDDEDEEGGHWTVPKIIGIAAAGLCLAAILAASVQFLLRKREKKLAFKLRRHKE